MTQKEGTLRIGYKIIAYRVKQGKGQKYVRIKFTDNLELEVTVPQRGDIDVEDILHKKKQWIATRYTELSGGKQVFANGKVLYKGRYRRLKKNPAEHTTIKVEPSMIKMATSNSNPKHVLKQWMHHQTRDMVTKKAKRYAQALNVEYQQIYVRTMKKWGSCSKKGNLTFNELLIALPTKVADYVVAHEVTHLAEFNHTQRFRQKLEKICPNSERKEQQLRKYIPS